MMTTRWVMLWALSGHREGPVICHCPAVVEKLRSPDGRKVGPADWGGSRKEQSQGGWLWGPRRSTVCFL